MPIVDQYTNDIPYHYTRLMVHRYSANTDYLCYCDRLLFDLSDEHLTDTYSQTRSSVPVANELMNSFTEK